MTSLHRKRQGIRLRLRHAAGAVVLSMNREDRRGKARTLCVRLDSRYFCLRAVAPLGVGAPVAALSVTECKHRTERPPRGGGLGFDRAGSTWVAAVGPSFSRSRGLSSLGVHGCDPATFGRDGGTLQTRAGPADKQGGASGDHSPDGNNYRQRSHVNLLKVEDRDRVSEVGGRRVDDQEYGVARPALI